LFSDFGDPLTAVGKAERENQALAFLLLRQVFLAFSKLQDVEPLGDIDREVESFKSRVTTRPTITCDSMILSTARALLRDVLMDGNQMDARLAQWVDEPWGAHGPGAVANSEEGFEKWEFRDMRVHGRVLDSSCLDGKVVENYVPFHDLEYASRLAVVPKDYRKHRIICIEQKELMFAQQGVMNTLFDVVHSHPLASRAINFHDQTPSMRLSRNRRFSTIDLKDASDLVSLPLLRLLFPKEVYKLVTSLRSRSIYQNGSLTPVVAEGELVTAFTMGNALCFPIETLVFWALSLATLIVKDSRQRFPGGITQAVQGLVSPTLSRVEWYQRYPLRVFGDDIIVPARHHADVVETLEACGLQVNLEKSCSMLTPIREACGSFWLHGLDVTVVKLTYHSLVSNLAWVSLADSAVRLASSGFLHCSLTLTRFLAEKYPVAYDLLGFPTQGGKSDWVRWNLVYQRRELRVPCFIDTVTRLLPGRPGLYSWLTQKATLAVFPGHGNNAITEKWVPADLR